MDRENRLVRSRYTDTNWKRLLENGLINEVGELQDKFSQIKDFNEFKERIGPFKDSLDEYLAKQMFESLKDIVANKEAMDSVVRICETNH